MNPFQAMNQFKQIMNNPAGMIKSQMIEKLKNMNPQMYDQVMQMTNGKTEDQLREMAMNVAKDRGIDIKQFAQQFGINI